MDVTMPQETTSVDVSMPPPSSPIKPPPNTTSPQRRSPRHTKKKSITDNSPSKRIKKATDEIKVYEDSLRSGSAKTHKLLKDKTICYMRIPIQQISPGPNSRLGRGGGIEEMKMGILTEGYKEDAGNITVMCVTTNIVDATCLSHPLARSVISKDLVGDKLTREEAAYAKEKLSSMCYKTVDGFHRVEGLKLARAFRASGQSSLSTRASADVSLPDTLMCRVLQPLDAQEYYRLSQHCNRSVLVCLLFGHDCMLAACNPLFEKKQSVHHNHTTGAPFVFVLCIYVAGEQNDLCL
jgi:hypothetical protein